MNILKTLTIAVAIGVIAIVGYVYSGIYDVSAGSSHSGIANWLLSTTSHASIKRQAKAIEVPDLNDDALALAGVNDFSEMCAGCHGAPGREPGAIGQGLNPPPPDLAGAALEMSPAELFWVTKHGIRMTGMPAWGVTHDDAAIWPVVAFITKLPELDAVQYEDLLSQAKGMGHHSRDSGQSEDLPKEPETHDQSTHEHPIN
jgi:mono/diheme cytochrome c family protein